MANLLGLADKPPEDQYVIYVFSHKPKQVGEALNTNTQTANPSSFRFYANLAISRIHISDRNKVNDNE